MAFLKYYFFSDFILQKMYAYCLQTVLQRRDAIQADYERTMDELAKRKEEREQVVNVSISNLQTLNKAQIHV